MGLKETFFIAHGSPTLPIEKTIPARDFFLSWKEKAYQQRPKAILVISAHWDTNEPCVNVVDRNDTIYDFCGFPEPLYKIKYMPPGAPELAKRVKELLTESGFKRVHEDWKRGLDHGAWNPLWLMHPECDIPVFQLSLQSSKDGTYHYNMGKALAPLKDEEILIIGSGAATHNLGTMGTGTLPSWASEFDSWLKDALLEGRYEDVNQYEVKAPHAKMAHPTPEHFYPLHVAMGAAGENAKAKLIHHSWHFGTLSYASYQFTAQE